ncbi:MAG: PilZ domain-containing protein [Myxococcota bacterium]
MHGQAQSDHILSRRIALCLTENSLAHQVQDALQNLGYTLLDLDLDHEAAKSGEDARLWLVDENRLSEVPDLERRPEIQIALLSDPADCDERLPRDTRVFARVPKPGRLTPVYEMLQTALEGTPRRLPRVETRISARCISDQSRSMGAVLSLSEGGCLLRSQEGFQRGARIELQFALPAFGLVTANAECRYAKGTDLGLAFPEAGQETRSAIAHFVTAQLALAESLASGLSASATA